MVTWSFERNYTDSPFEFGWVVFEPGVCFADLGDVGFELVDDVVSLFVGVVLDVVGEGAVAGVDVGGGPTVDHGDHAGGGDGSPALVEGVLLAGVEAPLLVQLLDGGEDLEGLVDGADRPALGPVGLSDPFGVAGDAFDRHLSEHDAAEGGDDL